MGGRRPFHFSYGSVIGNGGDTLRTIQLLRRSIDALGCHGRPEIFNTGEGSQYTGVALCGRPASGSRWMAGPVCRDNILMERCGIRSDTRPSINANLNESFVARRVIATVSGSTTARDRPRRTTAECQLRPTAATRLSIVMDDLLRALSMNACVLMRKAQQQQQGGQLKGILEVEETISIDLKFRRQLVRLRAGLRIRSIAIRLRISVEPGQAA